MRILIITLTIALILSLSCADNISNKYTREVLPNGLTVIIKYNPDSRIFAVDILGKNRAAMEEPDKAGITDLVNRMLVKGTKAKNAEEVQAALDDIGARLKTNDSPYMPYDDRYTWRAFSFIRFETIDEYAEKGLDILHEIVTEPAFSPTELSKTKNRVMGIMGMESGSTYKVCRNLYYSKLFENHPLSNKVLGGRRNLMSITSEDLAQYHQKYYAPDNLILTVVSNINPRNVMDWVKIRFGNMTASDGENINLPDAVKAKGIVEIKEPMDKEQIYIYIGNIVPGLKSDSVPALKLTLEILSTRLKLNLREKQGLAYSVGAGGRFLENFGWYTCAIGTGYKNFTVAKNGILAEIEKLKNEPVEQAELDKARNSLWGSMLMRNMSCINQAYYMAYYEFVNVGYDHDDGCRKRLDKINIDDVQQAAKAYLDAENYVLAYVGKINK
ncbi:MAG: insulinase family protein [candidate division Zixibacteria bacterium]|nr:insulinase family protein [candidate division Zixibacteria bacterium]